MEKILKRIVENKGLETEWLDLLSQLEYVGFRKISKSVSYQDIDLSLLQHLQEEVGHALLLKRLVERRGLRDRSWSQNVFSDIGWEYFQSLDRRVSETQNGAKACYATVSWAIETRALKVYPLYARHTRDSQIKKVIAQILSQEKGHLSQMEAFPMEASVREKVLGIENELWEAFEEKLFARIETICRNLNTSLQSPAQILTH